MPEIIFDNCVLSNFALTDSFYILKELYASSSYVTEFVVIENSKGFLKDYRGLCALRNAIKEGWIKELNLRNKQEKTLFQVLHISLGAGEASSIAIAKTRYFLFACDDRVARREAEFLGIKLTGTIGILTKAIKNKVVSRGKATAILKKMIKQGFYSPVTSLN